MMNFFKEVFSKKNMRYIGVLNYLAASGGSKDAIMLYNEMQNEMQNENDYELNKEKVA